MRLTKAEAEVFVNKGVKFLDERIPGWYDDIIIEKLDLSTPSCCIEGQLLGGLSTDAFERLNLLLGIDECWLGFNLYSEHNNKASWKILTNAWKRKLTQLQNA